MFRDRVKWLLFPGINLHARQRYRRLPAAFGGGASDGRGRVLDAGCGNGMLSWQAWRQGNRVLGVSLKSGEVERNRRLFHGMLGAPESELEFRLLNLYEVDKLGEQFDQIVCSEVLEHIRGDEQVAKGFFRILKPGGTLHLCCPNAEHPDNRACPLDEQEAGGHVRPGYTEQTYRSLLEPLGFEVGTPVGLGGPVRQWWNRKITKAQEAAGLMPGLLLFFLAWPTLVFDARRPDTPVSLYVRALKPAGRA